MYQPYLILPSNLDSYVVLLILIIYSKIHTCRLKGFREKKNKEKREIIFPSLYTTLSGGFSLYLHYELSFSSAKL